MELPVTLMRGALVACCCVAGLFFFRFFRSTGDRLFLFFASSFWIFSLNWLGLALVGGPPESRHLIYLFRLVAFGLILVGIWDKNRREKRFRPQPRSPLLEGLTAGAVHRRTRQ